MNGVLVSHASMAKDNVHIHLISALCEPTKRRKRQGRGVQAPSMASVRVWSLREALRLVAWRKMVSGSKKNGSSSPSASWEGAEGRRPGDRSRVQIEIELRYGEVQVDGSTKLGAVSQTLSCVLPKKVKVHRTLKAPAELKVVRITAPRMFWLR